MKKSVLLFLALVLMLGCAACGSAPAESAAAPAPTAQPEQAPTETAAVEPEAVEPQTAPEETIPEPAKAQPTEKAAAEAEPHSTVLVVYFSCTGTTRGVAERIAALTGGDLAEIVPVQPYTDEDLNYQDHSTRATVEQNTPDARPEIANEISLEGYTTVYLGYPIWWGDAPRILSSFVESHDFTGITVIPFCTSGGSGAGRSGEHLGEQAGTGTFLSSTRLDAGISEEKLQNWIDSNS